MSEEELVSLFTPKHKLLPEDMWPLGTLVSISDGLVLRSTWGLNPKNVVISDFEIVVAVLMADSGWSGGKPYGIHHDQIQIGFKHNGTKRKTVVDLGLIERYGSYPTVGELIALAQPEADS